MVKIFRMESSVVLFLVFPICFARIWIKFNNIAKRSIGAIVWWPDNKPFDMVMYQFKFCYYTAIKDGWSLTTCTCISVLDFDFIPDDSYKPDDMHTKLIGLYERYFVVGHHSLPDGRGSIVLAMRHPKCHRRIGAIRYNLVDTYLTKKYYPYNVEVYKELQAYVYWNFCRVYTAEPIYDYRYGGFPIKPCTLYPSSFDLPLTKEIKKEVAEEGRVCLLKTGCPIDLGLPMVCGSDDEGIGITTAHCMNCRNVEVFLREEFSNEESRFPLIKKKFRTTFIINESRSRKDPYFPFYATPKSSSEKLSSPISYFLTMLRVTLIHFTRYLTNLEFTLGTLFS